MALLELKDGARVMTAGGDVLGEIERFVFNPTAHEVTHLVVKRGVMFTEERVVPVERVQHTDEDSNVWLDADADHEAFQPFQAGEYVALGESSRSRLDPRLSDTPLGNYPVAIGMYPGHPVYLAEPLPSGTTIQERNVPEGSAVIGKVTTVVGPDGEDIGRISDISIDEDGNLVGVTVDPGFFRTERFIPGHWVDSIDEDVVKLAVGEDTLREFADTTR